MARTGGDGPRGISTFIVDRDTPGLSFGAQERKMGWHAQPTAQVILDGVRIPSSRLLGNEEGIGFGIAMNGSTAAGSISRPPARRGAVGVRSRRGVRRIARSVRWQADRRADDPLHPRRWPPRYAHRG